MIATDSSLDQRGPTRTCVGCRESTAPSELVRLVLGPEGQVVPDLAGGAQGRGAWVHARPTCIERAAPRGLSKSYKAEVTVTPASLVADLRAAARRRVTSLLGAASGARKLAIGATPVKEELAAGTVCLLVVATDARAAVESREVARAISDGLAVAWGTKAELGAATRRNEAGVIGVLDSGFASALRHGIELCLMPEPKVRLSTGGADSTEE